VSEAQFLAEFGHITHMNDNIDADAEQILTSSHTVWTGRDCSLDHKCPGWRRRRRIFKPYSTTTAERPRLPQAAMDCSCRQLSILEAGGDLLAVITKRYVLIFYCVLFDAFLVL